MATGTNPEITINMVMQNIFLACDDNNCGLVPVSHLIDYITPFLQNNQENLMELKMALDPMSTNIAVDQETFYEKMSEWAQKINMDGSTNNSMTSSPCGDFYKQFKPSCISSPKSNRGIQLIENYNESIASISAPCDNETGKSFFEDQIKELTHQNKKLIDEMALMKTQFLAGEEQNEALQAEMKVLLKQLTNERDLNKDLQKENAKSEEVREALSIAQKHVGKIQRALHASEKEIANLENSVSVVESEKLKLEEKIVRLHLKMDDSVCTIIQLQTDLDKKDKELCNMKTVTDDLILKLHERELIMKDFEDDITRLQLEKEKALRGEIKLHLCSDDPFDPDDTDDSLPPFMYDAQSSSSTNKSLNISLSDQITERDIAMNSNMHLPSLQFEFIQVGNDPNLHRNLPESFSKECQVNIIDEEQLINTIADLNLQITSLTHENEELRLKYETEKSQLQLKCTKVQDDLEKSSKKLEHLLQTVKQSELEIEELREIYHLQFEDIAQVKSENANLQKQYEQTEKTYESKLRSLEEEIGALKENQIELINNAELKDKIASLETENCNFKEQIITLNTIKWTSDMLSQKIQDLERQLSIEKLEKEVIAYEQKLIVTDVETQLEESRTNFAQLEAQYSTSCQEIKELNSKIKELQDDMEILNGFNEYEQSVESHVGRREKYGFGNREKGSPVRNGAFARMERRQEYLQRHIDDLEEQLRNVRELSNNVMLPASRPISPDSPNLENFETVEQCSSSSWSSDLITSSCPQEITSSDPHALIESVNGDAFGTSDRMYILENLGCHFEEITNGNLSEEEVQEAFKLSVLEFRLDSAKIKEKCENSFTALNSAETKLIAIMQEVTAVMRSSLPKPQLQETDAKMKFLLQNLMHATRLAEQYGALKQDHSWLKKYSIAIKYLSHLNRKMKNTPQELEHHRCRKCRGQLIMTDEYLCPVVKPRLQESQNRWKSLVKCQVVFLFTLMCSLFVIHHFKSELSDLLVEKILESQRKTYPYGPPPT